MVRADGRQEARHLDRGQTIFVVRHGETEANRAGRLLGHSDSPLTRHGIAQSLAFADALSNLLTDRTAVELHSSPLGRARSTARLIADRLSLDPGQCRVSPLLAELCFGQWEGLTDPEIEARYPGAQQARHQDHWTYVIPGGESYEQLYRRVGIWLDEAGDAPAIILVTHAKTSRALRGAYLGLDAPEILALKHPQDRLFSMRNRQIETILCPPTDNEGGRTGAPPTGLRPAGDPISFDLDQDE